MKPANGPVQRRTPSRDAAVAIWHGNRSPLPRRNKKARCTGYHHMRFRHGSLTPLGLLAALALLREQGQKAILLVKQYLQFARGLADRLAVMDRGQVVLTGRPDQLDDADVRRHLTV
jgi:hypothetical protein